MLHLIGKFERDYHRCHVCELICRIYIISSFQCEKIKLRERTELKLEKTEKGGENGKSAAARLRWVIWPKSWSGHLYVNPSAYSYRSEIHEKPGNNAIRHKRQVSILQFLLIRRTYSSLLNSCRIRDSQRMIGEQMIGEVRIAGDIWHIRQRKKRSNSPLHSVFIEKYFAGTRISRPKSKRDMKIDLHETCVERNTSPGSPIFNWQHLRAIFCIKF